MTNQEPQAEQTKSKGGAMIMIAGGMLSLGAAAAGFFLPTLAPQMFQADGAEAAPSERPAPKSTDFQFIEFGEVVVNIDSDRFNRYLKANLTLQVDKVRKEEIEKLIEARRAMLRGWLLSHLADKTMEEIRGAAGQNRLRREIHDQFNTILFTDGYEPIEDVYFQEFNIQ